MEIPATITSKGQITIPAAVRKALRLDAGDRVVFRLVDGRVFIQAENASNERATNVELEKLSDFFDIAGSVPVPAGVDAADWPAQREAAWMATAHARM